MEIQEFRDGLVFANLVGSFQEEAGVVVGFAATMECLAGLALVEAIGEIGVVGAVEVAATMDYLAGLALVGAIGEIEANLEIELLPVEDESSDFWDCLDPMVLAPRLAVFDSKVQQSLLEHSEGGSNDYSGYLDHSTLADSMGSRDFVVVDADSSWVLGS